MSPRSLVLAVFVSKIKWGYKEFLKEFSL